MRHEELITLPGSALKIVQLANGLKNMSDVMTTIVDAMRTHVPPGEDVARDLAGLDRAIGHLSYIADQLLDAGDARPHAHQPADVNEVVADMLRVCQQISGRGISVSATLGATAPRVDANRVELEWILVNLICNARDAMPEGGVLTIDTATTATGPMGPLRVTARSQEYVRLTVADTGQGVAPAMDDSLADQWFWASEHGPALGLTSVALMARRLHGWVHVKSNRPQGLQVQVYLPVVSDQT